MKSTNIKIITYLLAFVTVLGGLFLFNKPTISNVAITPGVQVVEEVRGQKQTKSKYTESYSISDSKYGTEVSVTVGDGTRTIISNALPDHETGKFPTKGNPNTISAQSDMYVYSLTPTWTGLATWARQPGVAINGIKFEPETAERVSCSSGEVYRVEAVQDMVNLGLDFNNAHVQPTGAYHYHGVSQELTDMYDTGDDLVHVGFAADGYLIYYSQSGKYKPSYKITGDTRTGTGCKLSLGGGSGKSTTVEVQGTKADGTYVSDWEYVDGVGDLDQCNGTIIDGVYAYVMTEEYPFIGRCLNGSFTESGPGGQRESGSNDDEQRDSRNTQQIRGGDPPAEAIEACKSKAVSNSCAVATPRGQLSGVCENLQGQTSLVCVPQR